MSNPYEDWDEYDWQNHIHKVSHDHFLTTKEGKQWQINQKKEKQTETLKYFVLIVIALVILLLIVRAGGCNLHSSNEPYKP
jgi:hypothetical protein